MKVLAYPSVYYFAAHGVTDIHKGLTWTSTGWINGFTRVAVENYSVSHGKAIFWVHPVLLHMLAILPEAAGADIPVGVLAR